MGWPDWRSIESAPKDGTPIRLFALELLHLDFNPGGSVEGYWQDGEGWIGAVWCDAHDHWQARVINPSMWQPLPSPPPVGVCDCADRGERDCPRCGYLWSGGPQNKGV